MSLFSKTREDLHAVVVEHAQLLGQVKEMNTVALTSSNISDQIKNKKNQVANRKPVELVDQFGNSIDEKTIRPQGSTTPDLNYAYIGAYGAGGGGRPTQIRKPFESTPAFRATVGSRTKANEYGFAGRMLERLGFPLEPLFVLAWNMVYAANGQGANLPTADQVQEQYEFLSYHPELTVNITGRNYTPVYSGGGQPSGNGQRTNRTNQSNLNTGYPQSSQPNRVSSNSGKNVVDAVSRSGSQIVGALGRIERKLEAATSSDFRRIIGQ